MKVPIRNVYYLLCYACAERAIDEAVEWARVGDGPDSLPNLLAFVLTRRLKPLLRRGIDRNYLQTEEESIVPRGRIDFGSTIRQCSVRRQRVVCRRDELDVNVLHNQILRTTVRILANHPRIGAQQRLELILLERLLHPVDVIPVDSGVFRRVHVHRNNAEYQFLMKICELIWLDLLPEPDHLGRRSMFEAIRDDDRIMERVFEEFIGNFYRLETPSFDVSTQRTLKWDASDGSDLNYLPVMRADAVLRSRSTGWTLVIDAKYYKDALVFFHDKERVRSEHLYQITAYLRSTELKGANIEGLLIYPRSGDSVSANFHLSGRRIRVRTLDLNKDWREVHESLCNLVSAADSD